MISACDGVSRSSTEVATLPPGFLQQVIDAYQGLSNLMASTPTTLFGSSGTSPVERLQLMEAIPTTRDKDGKFLRPEMTTLDALRMLFWDDLPAPKEEEPPKLDPQMKLAGFEEEEAATTRRKRRTKRSSRGAGEKGSGGEREKGRMSLLHDFERQLESLTRAEKAQLLQWVARDIGDSFPGIESTPRICGGEPCIVRTRIPVWVLEQSRRQGISEAELLRNYPTLRAEDLANAWAYVRAHRQEIDQQIRENEEA